MNRRMVIWIIAVFLCCLLPAYGKKTKTDESAKASENAELEKRVTGFVQPLIDNQWTRGMVVGVWQNGNEDYLGYGAISEQNTNTPDKDTVFEIGSITKVFTALVLADMVVNGEVKLDDPVQKYLPDDIALPPPGDKPVTLASLARHQSGIPNVPLNFWEPGDNNYDPNVGGLRWGSYSEDKLRKFFEKPYPPLDNSRKYIYSNLGMGTLGFALERHAGKSLGTLITSRICEPLGMDSTGFELKTTGPGHDADGQVAENWPLNESILGGAFALRSTCKDMLAFGAAQLDPNSTTLKSAIKLAIKPGGKVSAVESIGLGWRINQFNVIISNGATGGFRATIFIHPPTKTVVVVMVNSQLGGVVGGRATLFDLMAGHLVNVVLKAPAPDLKLPTVAEANVAEFLDYVGTWTNEDGSRNPRIPIRVEDGKLMMIGPGKMSMRLWPSGNETFFVRSYNGEFKFNRDESGNVSVLDVQFDQHSAKMIRKKK